MLPAELIFQIVELLQHDKPSLASCTLVSTLWHNIARPYLFADLTVAKQYKSFFAFCEQNRDFAALIRTLHIVQLWSGLWLFNFGDLKTALPLLPSLHTLSILGYHRAGKPVPLGDIIPGGRSRQKVSLQRLNLTPTWDGTISEVLPALLSLFVVNSLCITGAPASFTPFLAPVPIDEILRSISFLQNSTQLGELVILDQSDRSRSEVCVRVIEHILQPGSLRALAVDTGDRLHHQTMHICQLLISHVSQNLMNVHIQFRIERHSNLSIFFTGSHAQALGSCLARCAQLACLRIAIDCPAFESVDLVDASLPVPFFSNLLSSLPVALRVFAVRLSPPSSDWWEFCSMILDMPVLDDLLPRPGGRFPHLHRFDLEVYKSRALPPWASPPNSLDEYQDALVPVLPRLRDRDPGLLRFTIVYSYYNLHQECEIFRPEL